MKRPLYWLMLTLLLVAMSELQTMGMMPDMARSLGASTATVGTLISVYSFGMAIGGPLIAWALRLTPPKTALLASSSLTPFWKLRSLWCTTTGGSPHFDC